MELPIFSGIIIIFGDCYRAIFSLFVPHSSLTLALLVSKTPSYSHYSASMAAGDSLIASCSLLHVMESHLALCFDTVTPALLCGYKGLSKVTLSQSMFKAQLWSLKLLILRSFI